MKTEQIVNVAKQLHTGTTLVAGYELKMGYLHIVKEIRTQFDLSYPSAIFIMTLAGIPR